MTLPAFNHVAMGLTFDGAHHGAVASPLLGVCEVRPGVQVGGDEQAARVLRDAQRRVLDLVVVDELVKAHDHRAHLRAASALV